MCTAEDFHNYDTTIATSSTLIKNIAYNAHKKATVSTSDNQVSSVVNESTATPTYGTEYDYISALSSRVPRPVQSLDSAFDNSISTAENIAYHTHGIVQ